MAGADGRHVIRGMDDLRRELRRASNESTRAFGLLNHGAAMIIQEAAEARGRRLGGVHGHVVRMNSIRASKKSRAAVIRIGGTAAKHGPALGAEFGAKQYPQFPDWRGNQWQAWGTNGVGYMVHPSIREKEEEVLDHYDRGILELFADVFPD
jgi:hypothetical protein